MTVWAVACGVCVCFGLLLLGTAGAPASRWHEGRGSLGSRAAARRRLTWPTSRAARTRATAAAIGEACDALAADLWSGRPPVQALASASELWAPLARAVEAHDLGGDVPESLRELAANPGAADLRLLAAAWQVAHRSGHGLADGVGRVAADIDARRRSRRVVDSELASARATARLLAGLPVVALLMGAGSGADPLAFLLTTPVGWAAAAGGLLLIAAGLAWIEALARGASR